MEKISWHDHGMVNAYKSHLNQMIKSIVPTSFFLGFLGEELAALGPGMIFGTENHKTAMAGTRNGVLRLDFNMKCEGSSEFSWVGLL